MAAIKLIFAFIVHVIVVLTGVLMFLRLKKQMESEKIPNAPTVELFIIFATYGGVLLVILTALFGTFSGLASLGIFYLILAAPIILGIIAILHRETRTVSKYHRWTYLSAALYCGIVAVTIIVFMLVTKS